MDIQQRVFLGFSAAPPLTDDSLTEYRAVVNSSPQGLNKVQKAILEELLNCVERWWQLPESQSRKQLHVTGAAFITPLDANTQDQLASVLPAAEDIRVYETCLDSITETPIRNMAFHLMWFVKELALGKREPVTTDKLTR